VEFARNGGQKLLNRVVGSWGVQKKVNSSDGGGAPLNLRSLMHLGQQPLCVLRDVQKGISHWNTSSGKKNTVGEGVKNFDVESVELEGKAGGSGSGDKAKNMGRIFGVSKFETFCINAINSRRKIVG